MAIKNINTIQHQADLEYIKDKLQCRWSPEQIYNRKCDKVLGFGSVQDL